MRGHTRRPRIKGVWHGGTLFGSILAPTAGQVVIHSGMITLDELSDDAFRGGFTVRQILLWIGMSDQTGVTSSLTQKDILMFITRDQLDEANVLAMSNASFAVIDPYVVDDPGPGGTIFGSTRDFMWTYPFFMVPLPAQASTSPMNLSACPYTIRVKRKFRFAEVPVLGMINKVAFDAAETLSYRVQYRMYVTPAA